MGYGATSLQCHLGSFAHKPSGILAEMNWFYEFALVYSMSWRLRLVMWLTLLLPPFVLLLGYFMIGRIEFAGPMQIVTEPIRSLLHDHYGKAALIMFFTGAADCFRIYKRDLRRIERNW